MTTDKKLLTDDELIVLLQIEEGLYYSAVLKVQESLSLSLWPAMEYVRDLALHHFQRKIFNYLES